MFRCRLSLSVSFVVELGLFFQAVLRSFGL
jgi:hypothetical protein